MRRACLRLTSEVTGMTETQRGDETQRTMLSALRRWRAKRLSWSLGRSTRQDLNDAERVLLKTVDAHYGAMSDAELEALG
jgi:hypothetical protein